MNLKKKIKPLTKAGRGSRPKKYKKKEPEPKTMLKSTYKPAEKLEVMPRERNLIIGKSEEAFEEFRIREGFTEKKKPRRCLKCDEMFDTVKANRICPKH